MPAPRRKKRKGFRRTAPPYIAKLLPSALALILPGDDQPLPAPFRGLVCEKRPREGYWYMMQVHHDGSHTQYLGPFRTEEKCKKYLP